MFRGTASSSGERSWHASLKVHSGYLGGVVRFVYSIDRGVVSGWLQPPTVNSCIRAFSTVKAIES